MVNQVPTLALAANQPFTVLVRRWPRVEAIVQWRRLNSDAIDAALDFSGHLGAIVLPSGATAERQLLIWFVSRDTFDAWRSSATANSWFERLGQLEDREPVFEEAAGLGVWFELPAHSTLPNAPPPRYKMAIATWLGVYPTITLLIWLFWPYLLPLAMPVRTLVLSLVMVPLLTWVVMPRLMKALQSWLSQGKEAP